MKLIGISGSSLCDWMIISGNETVAETTTMGFNPFFHNEVLVKYTIERSPVIMKYADQIEEIYFYGAGCSSEDRVEVIYRAFQLIFTNKKISVQHDLVGAVNATADDEPCIVCILGTGSNSCYYNGNEIIEAVPSLGHFLGNEGGGSYFGRKLLTLFLYKKLPSHIYELLETHHSLDKEIIFKNVYNMPNSNVFLASFMKTLTTVKEDPFVVDFIYKGFSKFISYHVWPHKAYKKVPTHFTGSVAYFFEDLLREVCYKHRLEVGKVIQKPIYSLTDYHKSH